MKIIRRLILILSFSLSTLISQRVVGYYPYWMQNEFPVNNIDLTVVTHVIHAFGWPDQNGNVLSYSNMFNPGISGPIHDEGRKFLLSLGGWGNDAGFSIVSASSALRQTFINNLINVCDNNGYDGVDIDWEFPQSVIERDNLNLLISEMDSIFYNHNPNLLITMAVPTSNWYGQWYDFGYLKNYIDFFNAMTYSTHGSWSNHAGHNSPLYQSPPGDPDGSCHTGINYLVNTRGIPESQINMGLPFWGLQYNSSGINESFTGNVVDKRYYEISSLIGNGWTYQWDSVAYCPYLVKDDQTEILTFDDPESIRYKCEYAIEKDLGGVMIWALGYDMTGNGQELIQSIEQNYLGNESEQNAIIPTHLSLIAYPNPFNQSCKLDIEIPKNQFTTISIYDVLGNQVDILANKALSKGQHTFSWNAYNQTSGIYFIRIQSSNYMKTQKIMLIK